jgi:carbamoyltransferase
MRERINARIKHREPFRPFAPAVAVEATDAYFEGAAPDPFMQRVAAVRPEKRAEIPAVVHVDGTARLQAVTPEASPAFHRLLKAFEAETGVPVLLNTSFNESEPIVETPAQALDCFLRTRMDALVVGRTLVRRTGGPEARRARRGSSRSSATAPASSATRCGRRRRWGRG